MTFCRTCGTNLVSIGRNKKARYCNTKCANKYYYKQINYIPIPDEERKQRKQVEGLSQIERNRKNEIWANYKLDWADYLQLHIDQNGKCAICKIELSLTTVGSNFQANGMACVDHCHTTGRIRGLLCAHCNRALGSLKDNIVSLRNAIDYLERTS